MCARRFLGIAIAMLTFGSVALFGPVAAEAQSSQTLIALCRSAQVIRYLTGGRRALAGIDRLAGSLEDGLAISRSIDPELRRRAGAT